MKFGLTDATFAVSEKAFFVISLFIMFAEWKSLAFADIFTIFGDFYRFYNFTFFAIFLQVPQL